MSQLAWILETLEMNCKSVSLALTMPVWRSSDKTIMNQVPDCCISLLPHSVSLFNCFNTIAIGRYSLATMNHRAAVAGPVVPSLLAATHPAPSGSRDVTTHIIYTYLLIY